eukprot:162225-Hanusia_phi.AAC.2
MIGKSLAGMEEEAGRLERAIEELERRADTAAARRAGEREGARATQERRRATVVARRGAERERRRASEGWRRWGLWVENRRREAAA